MLPTDDKRGVSITDVDMPFLSMVRFMVKWAIASIPAIIILVVIWAFAAGAVGFVLAAWSPFARSGESSAVTPTQAQENAPPQTREAPMVSGDDVSKRTVYVNAGKVHRPGCPLLKSKTRPMMGSEAMKRSEVPCSECNPYVTERNAYDG